MASVSPDMYRKILQTANEAYVSASKCVHDSDDDGFTILVSWDSIDDAVDKCSYMLGQLKLAIDGLTKGSKRKDYYLKTQTDLNEQYNILRDAQKNRNS